MRPTRPVLLAILLLAVPASGLSQQPAAKPRAEVHPGSRTVGRRPPDMLRELNDSLERLAGTVSPAVVQIDVTGLGPIDEGNGTAASAIVRQHAVGSGVIVDPDGYIMTNAHVVEGARRIRVMLSRRVVGGGEGSQAGRVQVLDATLVGSERLADLALLKVEASNLPALRFNLERAPQPGQLVFAVGSPVGLRNSVTMGVISNAWRQLDPDNPMIYLQTDAPIRPGNSGGPLVDVTGTVVGLNTLVVGSAAGAESVGFAIPARIAEFVYRSLRHHGRVDRADIGVVGQTITPGIAGGLGLAQDWGVVIADVIPGGPAEAGGLQPADVILSVQGHPTHDLFEFISSLYLHPPGQNVSIEAMRGTRKLSFDLVPWLAQGRVEKPAGTPDLTKLHIEALGVLALDVDERLRGLLPNARGRTGVMVLGRARGFDSIDAGLRAGDVIHGLNRTTIESIEQLRAALAGLKRREPVVLRIERMGQFQYLAFEVD
jgi:serine protease Do